ncbi:MAG: carotenoid oxygenase family protein [Proteobacteria bacterium]|nr:carotenoid oxygenase family protein [Pseudomonadota bacterium]MCP4920719.1 carotenoid oxygenase family protein [Pseudomonadota bacterium]
MKRRSFLAGLGLLASSEAMAFYEPSDWATVMDADPGDMDLWISPTKITGRIPKELYGGEFLVNGPAHLVVGGRRMHPFDGHGFVRAFRFSASGVELRTRFVKTQALADEQDELVYRGLGTNPTTLRARTAGRRSTRTPRTRRSTRGTVGSMRASRPWRPPRWTPSRSRRSARSRSFLAHVRRHGDRLVGLGLTAGLETGLRWFELEGDEVVADHTWTEGPIFCHDIALGTCPTDAFRSTRAASRI